MREILEPLTLIPGIRLAALISPDGVPIALLEGARANLTSTEDRDFLDETHDFHAYAGLAAGWLGEIRRSVSPLSWDEPKRVVLRAARGTLVMNSGPGAVLLVVLEQGVGAEELRIPMEGAIARMQRHLRSMGSGPAEGAEPTPAHAPHAGMDANGRAAVSEPEPPFGTPPGGEPSQGDLLREGPRSSGDAAPNRFSESRGES